MGAPYPTSLSELTARVVALESGLSSFKELMDERNKRYDQRSTSQDAAVKSALETSEKAIIKTDTAVESRFQGVNEFRQTLADQAATLMPRSEYSVQHVALEEKVTAIENRVNQLQQNLSSLLARGGGIKETWGYIIAIAAIVIGGLVEFFRH